MATVSGQFFMAVFAAILAALFGLWLLPFPFFAG